MTTRSDRMIESAHDAMSLIAHENYL